MLDKSITLKFYKQKEIQEAIVEHARNKEIGTRYTDSFGKRPDILAYPRDVIELAIQGVTSFHASEEIWENPLALDSKLSKKELEELRTGWDLVLDIDCPDWEFSKITTFLFIKALVDNGVKNISCKFSGNKGFHIGVPFESFPPEMAGKKTKEMFPDGPRKISQYLLDYISKHYITINDKGITFDNHLFSLGELKLKFGDRKFIVTVCQTCRKEVSLEKEQLGEFVCPKCEFGIKSEKEFLKCPKCNVHMTKFENQRNFQNTLCLCGGDSYSLQFDPGSIIEVDTVLISSRHLYRMPYSLHEKSGLVSLPIDPYKVMEFEKSMADPKKIIMPIFAFLDRNVSEESARLLLARALDFEVKIEEEKNVERKFKEMEITSPIKEDFFPDCIKQISKGLEDGKKRGLFCLIHFLGKIGWSKSDIESYLHDWNKRNKEPLREVYIKGQLSSFKPGEKLPPNCSNEAYYKGIGIKCSTCSRFKNPVNYTLWRWRRHLRDMEENSFKKSKLDRSKSENNDI
ncbi:hypothetical protein HYX12_04075 [Candidatus Woesearchaeota archaeon]|nr:hypothetical protein [Candidatus Woesearchaeota archaeon]